MDLDTMALNAASQLKPRDAPSPFELCVDEGDVRAFVAFDRLICDRACGGLRIAPDLTIEEIRDQARLMTLKFALFGIACGGAKAGLVLRPEWGAADRRRALRLVGQALGPMLRRGLYIPGADMGCDGADLWQLRHGARLVSGEEPPHHSDSTSAYFAGTGAAIAAAIALEHRAGAVAGATLAVEGFGRVGRAAAFEFVRRGGRLRCVSNEHGAITGEDLAPMALAAFLLEHGDAAIGEFPRAKSLPRAALFAEPVDVIIPCARPAAIHSGNLMELRCHVIAPGGNCSVTDDAETALHARGVLSVPDFVANSAAVLIGHFAALDPSPQVVAWLMNVRFPTVVARVLDAAAARELPPVVVARELATRTLAITSQLGRPPRHEAVLRGAGNRWVRRLCPPVVEHGLVRRMTDGMLNGAETSARTATLRLRPGEYARGETVLPGGTQRSVRAALDRGDERDGGAIGRAHALVRGAYRRLPESVRYVLRPWNGIDEIASFLPSRPRVALQTEVAAARGLAATLSYRSTLLLLTGISRVAGTPLRLITDLAGEGLAYWSALLFTARPMSTTIGTLLGPWRFSRLDVAAFGADLVLLRHHRRERRHVRKLGFVSVPTWVQVEIDTSRSLNEIVIGTRSGRSSRKNDVRRITRAGLETRLARGTEEIGRFLRDWYLPYSRRRWGESFVPLSADWVRQAPRFCELLWIMRNDEQLGGLLVEPQGRALRLVASGFKDAGYAEDGLAAGSYYFLVREAVRRGFRRLRFGGARPVLSDGVLAFKHKWGGTIRPVRQWGYLALAIESGSPGARAMLAVHPVIVEMDGSFYALTDPDTANGPAEGALARMLEVGIRGVVSRERDGWRVGPVPPRR